MTEAEPPSLDGRIVGLVLAAGASTRMGAARNKLLLPIEGRPLIAWPVAALAARQVESVFVVLGHEAAAVRKALGDGEKRGLRFVEYPNWERGMGASIAFGMESILALGSPSAVVISVGDLPGLRRSTVETLIDAVTAWEGDDVICLPTYAGQDGHPVIFGRSHYGALRSLSGDRGARRLLDAYADRVLRIPVDTDAILRDVDTPDALASWQD